MKCRQTCAAYADGRGDNKGVEPEGVAVLNWASALAFIGLERTTRSAVAVFDVGDPARASFLDMIVSDDAGVLREGLVAFSSGSSWQWHTNPPPTASRPAGCRTAPCSMKSPPCPSRAPTALMLAGLRRRYVGWRSAPLIGRQVQFVEADAGLGVSAP